MPCTSQLLNCFPAQNLPVDIATPALKSGAQKDSLNSLPTQSSMQKTNKGIKVYLWYLFPIFPHMIHFIELILLHCAVFSESSVETLKRQLEKESDADQPDHPAEIAETSSGDESFYSATDNRDIFVCPYCKECSVQQFFFKEGCPKKTRSLEITNLFPYLDISGLADEDVIDLEDKLEPILGIS